MSEDWRKKAENILELLEKKRQKAKDLWNSQLWSEFFRITYITFEIKVDLLYIYENHQICPENSDYFNLLKNFQTKYNHFQIDENQYHKWRNLRNDIAHRDKEIDENTAKNANIFFNNINQKMDELLEKYIQPKLDYNGVQMVKSDYEILKEIESVMGKPLPHYSKCGFNDIFGFSQEEGFLTILAIDGREIEGTMKSILYPEFLKKIYIHGNNFPKFSDWLRKIITPKSIKKSTGIVIRVIDGEPWNENLRSGDFRNNCSINQTNMRLILVSEKIFQDLKMNEIKEKISEVSNRFGRILVDELVELLNSNSKITSENRYLTHKDKSQIILCIKAMIISSIKAMINDKEINGLFFETTSALVFEK